MPPTTHVQALRLSGLAAVGAGIVFFATVLYLFTVLPSAGFSFAMLDDRAVLLPWVAAHATRYGGLWVLYFVSQALLLPVPAACAEAAGDDSLGAGIARCCAWGATAAIVLGLVGLIVVYTTSPLVARAYMAAAAGEKHNVLLLGDLFADTGKEIRLFSELLLGLWLGSTGVALVRTTRSRASAWIVLAVGAYTLLVGVLKLLDPFNPLEDTLGFLLALGYVALGVELLRQSRQHAVAQPPPPVLAAQ